MKNAYRLNATINDSHIPTFNGHYIATFIHLGRKNGKLAYIEDLLFCEKCGRIMLPQDCPEDGDPCPCCGETQNICEFSWADYDSYDEIAEALEKSDLDIHKFIDDDDIAYRFGERE